MKRIYLIASVISFAYAISTADAATSSPIPALETRAATKALPIYSNTLIDKAPAGEVVTGVRNSYSCYYMGGDHYRGFEKGVLGEYVIGDDGCIYLRGVCYAATTISPATDTYLKLDKVDETTYVAHTPQPIWVDEMSDGSLFTAYATRVVFSQKSATSFGYEVQQMPDGDYNTDVYFTLKDGKLSQANQNTTEMNEEIFPEELIGFTTSTGGWIGFGDGCINISQPRNQPTILPDGLTAEKRSLDFNVLHVRDIPIDNAAIIEYAESGEDVYISNPSSKSQQWVKGRFDSQKATVTFGKQYLGIDEESGFAVWFIPAKYDKYINYFDIDDPDWGGDWFRTYEACDEIVFTVSGGKLIAPEGYALYFSHDSESLLETGIFAQPSIVGYQDKSCQPAPVKFTKYEEYDDLWGFGVIGFGIPSMSVDGNYIPSSELYYRVYPNDATEPFVFSPDDYIDMEVEPMTDVPYNYYEDFDFKANGVNHTVYFYHDWKKVGVQVVQKHDGVESCSEIVYTPGDGSGVDTISDSTETSKPRKYFRNGELIIVNGDREYNSQGIHIR